MKKLIGILLMSIVGLSLTVSAATEKRAVKSFTAIENNCSIDIIISQGNTYSLELIAPEKYLRKIETKVVANTLMVDIKGSVFSTEDFEIHLSVINLNEIVLQGSGDVEIKGILSAEDLNIEIHGSGDFEGDLNVKDLEISLHSSGDAEVSGVNGSLSVKQYGSGDFEGDNLHLGSAYFSIHSSGDTEVSGTSAMMELNQSGSGDFDGRSFNVKTAKVRKTSSGDADVYVTETMDAKISGSGNLTIKGNPDITNYSATGSGSIRSL